MPDIAAMAPADSQNAAKDSKKRKRKHGKHSKSESEAALGAAPEEIPTVDDATAREAKRRRKEEKRRQKEAPQGRRGTHQTKFDREGLCRSMRAKTPDQGLQFNL